MQGSDSESSDAVEPLQREEAGAVCKLAMPVVFRVLAAADKQAQPLFAFFKTQGKERKGRKRRIRPYTRRRMVVVGLAEEGTRTMVTESMPEGALVVFVLATRG